MRSLAAVDYAELAVALSALAAALTAWATARRAERAATRHPKPQEPVRPPGVYHAGRASDDPADDER